MKNFMEIVKRRYSVRNYLDKPVDRKLINKCIEAARLAPSAENTQPWRFIVVDDHELLEKLKKQAFSGIFSFTKWANSAPVIIVILAKPGFIANKLGAQVQKIHYHLLDIGISVEHLVLQAAELNLGTCWIGWFNIKGVRKILNIPKKYEIPGLVSLDHFKYDKKLNKKKKKPLSKILFFNKGDLE